MSKRKPTAMPGHTYVDETVNKPVDDDCDPLELKNILKNLSKDHPELTPHVIKQMSRKSAVQKKPYTKQEKKFIEETKISLTEEVFDVREVYDFKIKKGHPYVRVKWMDTIEPMVAVKIDPKHAEKSFTKHNNQGNFAKMMKFVDENPQYKRSFIDNSNNEFSDKEPTKGDKTLPTNQ